MKLKSELYAVDLCHVKLFMIIYAKFIPCLAKICQSYANFMPKWYANPRLGTF